MLSVIVPIYKQEKTITENLSKVYDVLIETKEDFEIIGVVDGHLDDSYNRAKLLKKPNIFIYEYQTNKGKGYAVRYGMAKARGNLICFIDAGTDIHPNGISMLLAHMKLYNADVVIGSKRHPASTVFYPAFRRIYSFGYHLALRVLFNLKLKDTQTGIKLYKREVLEQVLPRLTIKRFAFDIELLAVCYRLGFKKIYEAPVQIKFDYENTNWGSFTLFFDKNIRDIIYDTLAVFYRLRILKYYDDGNKRKWIYDKELQMKVNTGE